MVHGVTVLAVASTALVLQEVLAHGYVICTLRVQGVVIGVEVKRYGGGRDKWGGGGGSSRGDGGGGISSSLKR